MLRSFLFAGAAAIALSGAAAAQNPNLAPAYGSANLVSNFQPDPHVVYLQAGGDRDASSLSSNCWGTIADAPDYNITWSAVPSNGWPLIFGARSDADTTIAVRLPDGSYVCDDDGGGYPHPRVELDNPQSGTYNIWVGTYSSSAGYPNAALYISEVFEYDGFDLTPSAGPSAPAFPTNPNTPTIPTNPSTGGLNPNANGTFGSVTLVTGFADDPHRASIQSGGPIDASIADSSCWGNISSAPTYVLNYTAGDFWPLIIGVQSGGDTTLSVRTPSGRWVCDDDSGQGLNPRISFPPNSESGRYAIYVGTYGVQDNVAGQLLISELDEMIPGDGIDPVFPTNPTNPTNPITPPTPGLRPDISLPATNGTFSLNAGFVPDPNVTTLSPGGPIEANLALPGTNCRGYIPQAPHVELSYTAGSTWPLIISAGSSVDTTLAVNAPDGTWYCSDDDGEGLNPSLTFNSPQSGVYDIYVGSYWQGDSGRATLHISEVSSQ